MSPNDPRLLSVALVVAALVAGMVAYRWHTREQPLDPPRALHVLPDAPCPPERYALACERWATAATRCHATTFAGEVTTATYWGPERGAHGVALGASRSRLAVRSDACGDRDPTIEHEMGHALYGLPDRHTDGVMCGDPSMCTTTLPRRAP